MLMATTTSIPWLNTLIDTLLSIVAPILIVASVVGIIYAIWVGIKFVRAEDKSAREEAKQKLITVIIGIVATLVLIALFYILAFNAENIVNAIKSWGNQDITKNSNPAPAPSGGLIGWFLRK